MGNFLSTFFPLLVSILKVSPGVSSLSSGEIQMPFPSIASSCWGLFSTRCCFKVLIGEGNPNCYPLEFFQGKDQ